MSAEAEKRNYFIEIFKIIGFLMVALGNFGLVHSTLTKIDPSPWGKLMIYFSHYALELFFPLSGILIMQSLGRNSLKGFAARRIGRILPIYIVFTLLNFYLVEKLVGQSLFLPYIGHYVSMTINYVAEKPYADFTNNFWSLCVEEHFYVFVGCLYGILWKKRRDTFLAILFSIMMGLLFWRFFTVAFSNKISFIEIFESTHMRGATILFGCLFSWYAKDLSKKRNLYIYVCVTVMGLGFIFIPPVLSVMTQCNGFDWLGGTTNYDPINFFNPNTLPPCGFPMSQGAWLNTSIYGWYRILNITFANLFVAMTVSLGVMQAFALRNHKFHKLIQNKWIWLISRQTFSMYVVHMPIIMYLYFFERAWMKNITMWHGSLVVVGLSIVAGAVCYWVFEVYLYRRIVNAIDKERPIS